MAQHRTIDIVKGLGTIAAVIALLLGLIYVLVGLFFSV